MRSLWAVAALLTLPLLLMAFAGCGDVLGEGRKEAVPLEQVPPNVMKAAQERLPEVKFNSAFKTTKGIYEIRGKTKTGKIMEAELDASGKVILVE
jgi:hypothetical protein